MISKGNMGIDTIISIIKQLISMGESGDWSIYDLKESSRRKYNKELRKSLVQQLVNYRRLSKKTNSSLECLLDNKLLS